MSGDFDMTPGGAFELPTDAEPWNLREKLDALRGKYCVVKVTKEVARRSRYLGWMTWLPEKETGLVFYDPISEKKLVQYCPPDDVRPTRLGKKGGRRAVQAHARRGHPQGRRQRAART